MNDLEVLLRTIRCTSVSESVDNLANVYCHFLDKDYQTTRQGLISNILNSMTDRCAAIHAAIQLVNDVKIAKRTVMALLQQPTEERMVSTFLTAYVCGINIVSRGRYA